MKGQGLPAAHTQSAHDGNTVQALLYVLARCQQYGDACQKAGAQGRQFRKTFAPCQGAAHFRTGIVHIHEAGSPGQALLQPAPEFPEGLCFPGQSQTVAGAAGRPQQSTVPGIFQVHHHSWRKLEQTATLIRLLADNARHFQLVVAQGQSLTHFRTKLVLQTGAEKSLSPGRACLPGALRHIHL